jgi:hypothetical protein
VVLSISWRGLGTLSAVGDIEEYGAMICSLAALLRAKVLKDIPYSFGKQKARLTLA